MGEKRIISVFAFINLLRGGRSPFEVDCNVTEWECHILNKDDGTPFYFVRYDCRIRIHIGGETFETSGRMEKEKLRPTAEENKLLLHRYIFNKDPALKGRYLFNRKKYFQQVLNTITSSNPIHFNTLYFIIEWMEITAKWNVLPTIEEIEAIQTIELLNSIGRNQTKEQRLF